jgi:hypothetical protein
MGAELEVEVIALRDEIARVALEEGRPVDLVKIDTEGSEPELLASLPAGGHRCCGRTTAESGARASWTCPQPWIGTSPPGRPQLLVPIAKALTVSARPR